jgi:hypothetical protein
MLFFFLIIAIASGFFGVLLIVSPKLFSSISKSLSKTIATIDDATFKYKIPMGIVLIIISIMSFYAIYLHNLIGIDE